MAYNNYGLEQIGSWIMGLNPSFTGSMVFGAGSDIFNPANNYLESEVMRVPISWDWSGTVPQATANLVATDAVGSYIYELGLGVSSSAGSDVHSRDLSAIGLKDNTFTARITMNVRLSRG